MELALSVWSLASQQRENENIKIRYEMCDATQLLIPSHEVLRA